MKAFYTNRLPHLVPLGGCFFVTFCTHDSIPIHRSIPSKKDKFLDDFAVYDRRHDFSASLVDLTKLPQVEIVKSTLEELYELLYYCIMPNHVHKVINTGFKRAPEPLPKIMKKIKGISSRKINLALGKTGAFWQAESYDHLVRSDKELSMIGNYILENPVKAGLVTQWEDWPFSYAKYGWGE